jgi:pyruvate dehydrogenase E2 component (dihydrolipoamide acetyltransferase)
MAKNVIMPKAGMAMETGTIISWLKNEGDTVQVGEPLLEIETDKVSMEVEAEFSGTLLKILNGAGEVVPVTETIGYIGDPGELLLEESTASQSSMDPLSIQNNPPTPEALQHIGTFGNRNAAPNFRVAATPAARRVAAEKNIDLLQLSGSGEYSAIRVSDVLSVISVGDQNVNVSSLARRVAVDVEVNLSKVSGSGPKGRILRDDVMIAAAAASNRAGGNSPAEPDEHRPITGMRRVIADNMIKSHLSIPPVTLNTSANVSRLLKLRLELNEGASERGELKISVNDIVMKAVAIALARHRDLNSTTTGTEITLHGEINIGMAVALDEGLIVPVIHRADTLTVGRIARRSRDLSNRSRDRKLQAAELEGGTFTVTNLGMLGIESFNPIINSPEVAILGVCAIVEVPKVVNESLTIFHRMGLSLSIDHRVIDGAQGAYFLQTVVNLLENPLQIFR